MSQCIVFISVLLNLLSRTVYHPAFCMLAVWKCKMLMVIIRHIGIIRWKNIRKCSYLCVGSNYKFFSFLPWNPFKHREWNVP